MIILINLKTVIRILMIIYLTNFQTKIHESILILKNS